METVCHSFLSMPVKHTKFDNGFEVFTLAMDTALTFAKITFRAGNWQDGIRAGTAHFLEHLVYGGPEREDWHPSIKPLIYKGAKGNASTSDLSTEYHLIGPMELSEEMARCLMDITFKSVFDAKRVDVERRTVLDECRQMQPRFARRKKLMSKIYPHVPQWQRPGLGTPESIKEIDAEVLDSFHKTYYVPNLACLVVVGNADHEAIVRVAQASWMPSPKGTPDTKPDIVPKLHRTAVKQSHDPNSISIFFRGPEGHVDRYRISYALDLLDDPDVGMLFRRLRLKDRLVYGLDADWSSLPRSIDVDMVIPPFHFNYAEESLFEEVGKIMRNEFSEESFQLLKTRRRIGFDASREEDSKDDLTRKILRRWFEGDYEDRRAGILAVTRDEVAEAAGKFLRRDEYGCLHVFNDPDD